jgi:hypothetical protein
MYCVNEMSLLGEKKTILIVFLKNKKAYLLLIQNRSSDFSAELSGFYVYGSQTTYTLKDIQHG